MDTFNVETERVDKGWLLILVIWSAILLTLALYIGLCYFIKIPSDSAKIPADVLTKIRYILLGISVAELFIIRFVRKLALKVRAGEEVDACGSGQHPAVAKYFAATLVSAALAESIAIYGVVIYFMSGDVSLLYPFVIIAAAAMLYFRPRKDELHALAHEMRR
ncbi:MAG: hypothetical protein OEV64_09085 [Desulfobulbaceae bacterium]|nr:hypothetical protein [Desulfobulbaceae bacterium]